jgi:uncharacterized protein (TIGR04255 family)
VLLTVPANLPHHLAKAPLAEATFEFRYKPARSPIAQLLPGLLFAKLGGEYDRSEATPIAAIPEQLRSVDPNLRYQAEYRLSGDRASIFIGERVAGVSVTQPYEGWRRFRPRIDQFLKIVQESNLIATVERFSIKFVNVIPAAPDSQLDLLNLRLEIGGVKPPENGFRFRTEINDEAFLRVIDIATNAEVQFPNSEKASGLLLSLDCLRVLKGEDFWQMYQSEIESVHHQLKELFFGLITPKSLESMGPSYRENNGH